jgi:hypothetical protein
MASMNQSADVRCAASASAATQESIDASLAAPERPFVVPARSSKEREALKASIPGMFKMPIVSAALGPRYPVGTQGIWQACGTATDGKPVLLLDQLGEWHLRLFERRSGECWVGVSHDPKCKTLSPEVDGVEIVARLRFVEEWD